MLNTYILVMQSHLAECKVDLERLRKLFKEKDPERFDLKVAERTVQILIESCIGIGKHWVKAIRGTVSADAYDCFETLSQEGVSGIDLTLWKSVIGMRNALVHDYLKVDATIIKKVILEKQFYALLDFAEQGLRVLSAGQK